MSIKLGVWKFTSVFIWLVKKRQKGFTFKTSEGVRLKVHVLELIQRNFDYLLTSVKNVLETSNSHFWHLHSTVSKLKAF